ncbi:4-amino-4-deoxy-L-arabinose transferase and related glycosyltransferase of PMT family-like [Hymenobacter roseosalivarius DSM 11622]|uniref:4-amino-4-deoxy-L-arabinose transferase and related glycosyltransferase of PMT family-like n=1 Tax=Hymenobacter roseosalivarius DSM 11622 TaxID=645990 RepID=A0A1W1W3V9_9BACT|nr:glycosyltransferase family 39 protein [Hymenobacter roseosalivarius]SMC00318.1 4-amino-4-deoxy-L-arabinose transferase and related glycosyltransferase of PMT family-like [Hymenobacter roseosalivarius DSM 11622]
MFVGLFTIAFFLFAHEGLYDYDDYNYARYAHQLATGTFDLPPEPGHLDYTPLHQRLMVFGPVALFYKLLGVGIFTTTFWPLLCTLGTSLIFYLLYRQQAPVVASAAISLLGLHYFTLNLSIYLYPDNVLMFFAAGSAAALLHGRRAAQKHPVWWGLGFALLNFTALLSKETIVYYLPFYLGVLILDLWHGRHGKFWLAALSAGTTLLAIYLLVCQVAAHDLLYRFHVIESVNEVRKIGNTSTGYGGIVARITYMPLQLLIGTGLGVALLLVIVAATKSSRLSSDACYWLALAGSSLAFYWLGSTSLSYYNPNSLLPRMLTPLLPPLCLAAGFGLDYLVRTGRGGWFLALGLLGCAAWLRSSISIVYGLLGGFFALVAGLLSVGVGRKKVERYGPGTVFFAGATLAVLSLTIAIRPAYFMSKPSNSGYFAQQRVMQQELRGPAGGIVLMDNFSLHKCEIMYGFQVPTGLRFHRYAAYDTLRKVPGRPIWLLINRPILSNDELIPQVISASAEQVLTRFPHRKLHARDNGVELYLLLN